MNKRGRPPLPEGEKLVKTGVRLPQWMIDTCRSEGNLSVVIRRALENYLSG